MYYVCHICSIETFLTPLLIFHLSVLRLVLTEDIITRIIARQELWSDCNVQTVGDFGASRPAVAYLLVTRYCNCTVQISLARIDSNVNPCDILWWMGSDCSRQNAERTWIVCRDGFPPRSTKKQKRKKIFNFIPYEHSFLSYMAFSVYEVVRVACLLSSWLNRQVTRTTS